MDLLGLEIRKGLDIVCVPTSEATRIQAAALGIPLTTLDETPFLDLTIDGADEIDSELRLIKGGGVYLNNAKVGDEGAALSEADAVGGRLILLACGKKNKVLVIRG